jgi:hypothetical protein
MSLKMRGIFRFATIWIGLFLGALSSGESSDLVQTLSSSGVKASPSPESSKVSLKDAKLILRDFHLKQVAQLKALDRGNQTELKDFRISQDTKFKDWKVREQEARHRFFDEHRLGSERRVYIQNYVQRRDGLLKELISNKNKKAQELDVKLNQFKDEQTKKFQEVKMLLERGVRPDASF